MLPHNANLSQKEFHQTKYTDEISKQLLAEIRAKYNAWHQANLTLIGPHMKQAVEDEAIIRERVNLLNEYTEVVTHLFNTVRQHLTADWKGGVDFGLLRGWLMD